MEIRTTEEIRFTKTYKNEGWVAVDDIIKWLKEKEITLDWDAQWDIANKIEELASNKSDVKDD